MQESRLLLVTGSLQGGGAERVLSDMANFWSRKGILVTVATWSGPEVSDFYELEPRVVRVRLDPDMRQFSRLAKLLNHGTRIFRLRQLISKYKPAAVVSFITTSNVLTVLASMGLKTRVLISERIYPPAATTLPRSWAVLRKIVYRWSDEIVVQSAQSASWVEKHCRKRAVVIPNALRELPKIDCSRQPLILAVGSLTYQKGFDLLLKAFADVAGQFEEWNVTIVGRGKDHADLMRLRDALKLTDRVEFAGQVVDVETWMARAGIVVQPSRFEGFPNVILESMGMGAPVISSDCLTGPSDMIVDGVNGRLFPVEDVTYLKNVLVELMSQPAKREALGREASKITQLYDQESIMSRWEACMFGV